MFIVLNCTKFEIFLFVNSLTFYCYHIVILFITFIIIINNITLLTDYNYLSVKNVLNTVNELKMIVKILCC